MKEICQSDKCTGCCCCMNICPNDCITMKEDEFGNLKPVIDEEKCINCNLCKNRCPVNCKKKQGKTIDKVYAVWATDEKIRGSSSSGGIATISSKHIIQKNGHVVGAYLDKDLILKHLVEDKDIEKFKGSKYVQSYIGYTYREVKELLEKQEQVLFIGTPCQVGGLNSFLNKEYENLITIDLICHGVPSQKLFKEHIESINNELNTKIDEVTFRGEDNYYLSCYSKGNIVYKKSSREDLFFLGFLKGLFNRESCYQCEYANQNRVSDITIGDFWGLGSKKEFKHDIKDGVSLVITNTKKGERFLNEFKDQIFIEEREVSEALDNNEQLRKPSDKAEKFEEFRKIYVKDGFESACKICLKEDISEVNKENKINKIRTMILGKDEKDKGVRKVIFNILKLPYNFLKYLREELRYFSVIKFNKFPKVKTELETINELINSRKSLARLGDGEIGLIHEISLGFQKASPELAKRMDEVLTSDDPNVLVGLTNVFTYKGLRGLKKSEKKFWKQDIWEKRDIYTRLNSKKVYENASITRIYVRFKKKNKKADLFTLLKKIWDNEDVVFIEGNQTRIGVGNDLFDNAKSIQRIIAPNKNAFDKYKEILNAAKKVDKNKTILIALGPTATILAYDLGKLGYRALDIGHLDIEYEWFLKQADRKVPVEGKYVNEAKNGDQVEDIQDKKYAEQIICEIRGD